MKITVCWGMKPYSLIEMYESFGRQNSCHLQGLRINRICKLYAINLFARYGPLASCLIDIILIQKYKMVSVRASKHNAKFETKISFIDSGYLGINS